MKRVIFGASLLVVGMGFILGLAALSFPNDPYVRIDAAAPNANRSTIELEPGEEVRADLRISDLGLSRIELRIDATTRTRERPVLELREGRSGRLLIRRRVSVDREEDARPRVATSFDTIMPGAASTAELALRNPDGSSGSIEVGVVDCPCVASAAWSQEDRVGDLDIVTLAYVGAGRARLAEAMRRLDSLHGGWTGAKGVVAGSSIFVLALAGLVMAAAWSLPAKKETDRGDELR